MTQQCDVCAHSYTYHGLARDKEGYPIVHCASWGCDCTGWIPKERKPENYKEKPKWNT